MSDTRREVVSSSRLASYMRIADRYFPGVTPVDLVKTRRK
jgi:hypothetical protein